MITRTNLNHKRLFRPPQQATSYNGNALPDIARQSKAKRGQGQYISEPMLDQVEGMI